MAWITPSDVEPVLRQDLGADIYIDGLIDHAQGLAEVEIGVQDPASNAVQAVLSQIVARMWQDGESARVNPAGLAMEVSGPFTIQDSSPGTAGLGLTNREITALKRAIGKTSVGVMSLTRGPMETALVGEDPYGDTTYPADQDPFGL